MTSSLILGVFYAKLMNIERNAMNFKPNSQDLDICCSIWVDVDVVELVVEAVLVLVDEVLVTVTAFFRSKCSKPRSNRPDPPKTHMPP